VKDNDQTQDSAQRPRLAGLVARFKVQRKPIPTMAMCARPVYITIRGRCRACQSWYAALKAAGPGLSARIQGLAFGILTPIAVNDTGSQAGAFELRPPEGQSPVSDATRMRHEVQREFRGRLRVEPRQREEEASWSYLPPRIAGVGLEYARWIRPFFKPSVGTNQGDVDCKYEHT